MSAIKVIKNTGLHNKTLYTFENTHELVITGINSFLPWDDNLSLLILLFEY